MLNETSVAHGMGLEMSCVFDLFAAAGVALMAIPQARPSLLVRSRVLLLSMDAGPGLKFFPLRVAGFGGSGGAPSSASS